MKHLLIPTVGFCLLISMPAMADQAADEAAIRELSKKVHAAYNSHDAKTLVALYDETHEFWDGTKKGRTEQEAFFTELFKRAKNIEAKDPEEIGIVFVTSDVAIYKFRRQTIGMVDEKGNPVSDIKAMLARVVVKRNGKWLVAAWFARPIEE